MTAPLPMGVQRLIATLESVVPDATVSDQVSIVRPALETALVDPSTRTLYTGRLKSFLVWSAPGSLTLHASVHRSGHVTAPHDHGIAWAVYGVVAGPTTFSRLIPGDDGVHISASTDIELPPGATEVVWPGQVHAVANHGSGWGWNLVVRSRALNEISRRVFPSFERSR